MHARTYRYGFRVLGDCRQPRRLVDFDRATSGYAACDERCELERESYLSAFRFSDDFAAHLNGSGSTRRFDGPCWADRLWWDIDGEDDAGDATLHAARRLAKSMVETLHVEGDDLLIFWSGRKGFHVGMATAHWEPAPGRDFHRAARRFAETVAETAGVVIDAGVYDRVRCWRAANSRHPKSGLHKRRLVFDELMRMPLAAIRKLAEWPEPFEPPAPRYASEPAARLWAECGEQVRRASEVKAQRAVKGRGATRLNRQTLHFIREGATYPNRHRLLYSAAANLAELGAPLALCVALLEESALDCGLPPADVRRAIENGFQSVAGAAPGEGA
ncbi:MAG: DNA primase [Phycisphaerales bacterium]|nr:DNA primase [Phycisphaerales bacterium]